MKRLFCMVFFLSLSLSQAQAGKNSLGLELGFGNPLPLCLQLDVLEEDFCGPQLNPRLATRIEWHAVFPDGRFYPVLGLEYRRLLSEPSNLGMYVAPDELLFTAQVTNLKPRTTGRYFRGGLSLGVLRASKLTMAMMEELDCADACSQLGEVGTFLIPLTPIAGIVSGLGLEFGAGYQWKGFSTSINMMTDFFLFSVEIRSAYQLPI